MKKLLSLLLCILLVISFGTENVHAAGQTGGLLQSSVTVKQVGNELHIESDDDLFLSTICEVGSLKLVKNVLDMTTQNNANNVDYTVKEFKSNLPSIQEIHKEQDYAVIYNIDSILYNGFYGVVIEAPDYYWSSGAYDYLTIADCISKSDAPEYEVVENNDGSISISSDDTVFIDNIIEIGFSDENILDNSFSVSKNSFLISDTHNKITFSLGNDCPIANGEKNIWINNIAYNCPNELVTLTKRNLLPCPAFSTNLNDNGDLIITSDDASWINALCELRNYGLFTINGDHTVGEYGQDDYAIYWFGDMNYMYQYMSDPEPIKMMSLEKINDNTVSFSTYNQKGTYSGNCINGITYSTRLQAKGYEASEPFDVTFINAKKLLPNDVTFTIAGGMGIVHSNDTEFINKLSSAHDYYCYGRYYTISGNVTKCIEISLYDYDWELAYAPISIDQNTVAFDLTKYNDVPQDYFVDGTCLSIYYNNEFIDAFCMAMASIKIPAVVTTYNVTFNGNGATGSMDQVQAGGYYSLPKNGFDIPSGKEFVGWTVGDDTTERFVGEKTLIFSDKEIKAIWKDLPTPQVTVDDSLITVGSVINATPIENNQNATLGGDVSSLIPAGDIDKGAAVWMEVNPIENTDPDYTRMQRGFALENSGVLMECMEINIFKQIKGNTPEKVSETLNDAIISFDLTGKPELIKLAENGLLFVYNIHNGRVSDLIVGTYNPNTHVYTFTADEFSVFGFFKIGELPPEHHDHDKHIVLDTGVNS